MAFCSIQRSVFRIVLIALLFWTTPQSTAWASKTADNVSIACGAHSLWHAGISLAAPNPVTPVTSFFSGCVSLGASIYSRVVDPLPAAGPVISAVHAGPPAGLQAGTDALLVPGEPIVQAPQGRIVTLVGTDFSFDVNDMSVTVGGLPAQIFPLSTNTVMCIMLPLELVGLPATLDVQVTVSGMPGNLFPFQVLPGISPPSPQEAQEITTRLREKMALLSQLIVDFDWEANLDRENPSLTPTERAQALQGAQQMVQCSQDLLPEWPNLQFQFDTNQPVRDTSAIVLLQNPEIEAQTNMAINDLTNLAVPASQITGLAALTLFLMLAAAHFTRRRTSV